MAPNMLILTVYTICIYYTVYTSMTVQFKFFIASEADIPKFRPTSLSRRYPACGFGPLSFGDNGVDACVALARVREALVVTVH